MFAMCVWMVSLLPSSASAQVCLPGGAKTEQIQSAIKYLRRLSHDLRGRAPSYAELARIVKQGYVDSATIDAMLNDPRFVGQFREFIKDLLTLNTSDLRFEGGSLSVRFVRMKDDGTRVYSSRDPHNIFLDKGNIGQLVFLRGAVIHCLNEPAKYDKNGALLCKIKGTQTYRPCIDAYNDRRNKKKNVAQEGYVMVRPYWESDPTKTIKTCALAALKDPNPVYNKIQYYCDSARSRNAYARRHALLCGCGPNMKWCFRNAESVSKAKLVSMNTELMLSVMEQTLRMADRVARGASYTSLLQSKEIEVNGPISHLLRNAAYSTTRITVPSIKEMPNLPKLEYYQKSTWKKITFNSRQSGVLTLPFFMLKYATNRGRLHRYHNAFLCQYFTPPAGGLPAPTDACHQEPNLMKRCGCKHCHTTIEPEAAFWGRWQESAWFPLHSTDFPKTRTSCVSKKPSGMCKKLYLTESKHPSEDPYKGRLLSYVFATPSMEKNIQDGPQKLVQRDINNGKIAGCGVSKLWSWFVGYDLQPQQDYLKTRLINVFKNNKYNVKALLKAIVTSDEYRRGFDSHRKP